jgi:hypothetical protein
VEESAKMRLLQMVNLKFRPKGKKHQAGRWHIVGFHGKIMEIEKPLANV